MNELSQKNTYELKVYKIDFTKDQIALIKSQVAKKATDDELDMFLHQARRTGLDPLSRQIYCIHRKSRNPDGSYSEKMTIQTSIDGFRVIAERSNDYGGQDEPEFVEENGRLIACKVPVYRFRGDTRYKAAVGVAYLSEYKPEKGAQMWDKMPHVMLSKVAEAIALRKAFPQDLSGLYTDDEMAQSERVEKDITPKKETENKQVLIPEALASDESIAKMSRLFNDMLPDKIVPETFMKSVLEKCNVKLVSELSQGKVDQCIRYLQRNKNEYEMKQNLNLQRFPADEEDPGF